MTDWNNNDGLRVRFGTSKTVVALGGESTTDGNDRVITGILDFAKLNDMGTQTVLLENAPIPGGAVLREASIHVSESFAGTGTLTLGLIEEDRTTNIDEDAIDAAVAVGALTAGSTVDCDGAAVGLAVSSGASSSALVSATKGGGNFTAGKAQLVLKYYMP